VTHGTGGGVTEGGGSGGAAMAPWMKTVLASIGFLSDSYDLFVINIVLRVLEVVYPAPAGSTGSGGAGVSTAALVGGVAGQLVCGSLADVVGRRVIFVVTLVFIVVGSLGSATAMPTAASGDGGVYLQLALWRGLLGFGVGGEYPLSATVTSEGAAVASRGQAVSSVFAMQGVGNLAAALVMAALLSTPLSLDATWRIALAVGALPGLLTVYKRWQLEESSHYLREAGRGITAAAVAPPSGLPVVVPPVLGSSRAGGSLLELVTRVTSGGAASDGSSGGGSAGGSSGAGGRKSYKPNDSDAPSRAGSPTASPAAGGPAPLPPLLALGGASGPSALLRRQATLEIDEEAGSGLGGGAGSAGGGSASPAPATEGEGSRLLGDGGGGGGGGEAGVGAGGAVAAANGAASPRGPPPRLLSRLAGMAATVWEFRWTLLATAGSWFIFDIVFYANGLFSGAVLSAIGVGAGAGSATASDGGHRALALQDLDAARVSLLAQSLGNAVLAGIALPGYLLAVVFIDRLGRKRMQLLGFAAMSALFAILGGALTSLSSSLFVVLYGACGCAALAATELSNPTKSPPKPTAAGLTFFFSNFGPNVTTFVEPAEAFPTRARATGHGLSAAAGKLGAAAGAAVMPLLLVSGGGLSVVLWMCAGVSLAGLAWTWFLSVETGGIDFEALDVAAAGAVADGRRPH